MSRVALIGIELEGGWKKVPKGARIHEDISVNDIPPSDVIKHVGEISTPPLPLDEAIEEMVRCYPDVASVRCGLHVHVSLRTNLDYCRLMKRGYNSFFLKEMEEWGSEEGFPPAHPFWQRLFGRNRFCQRVFKPSEQLNIVHKLNNLTRRTQLNFPAKLHGTVECRLFPMFDEAKVSERAVRRFVYTVEEWLKREKKVFKMSAGVKVNLEKVRESMKREVA